MSRQHVDFQTSTDPDAATLASDGLDTGYTNSASVRPIENGEAAQQAGLRRASENLRTRTEVTRDELEALKYLSDADRALLLTSTGDITWTGVGTGTFSTTADITLKPFTAPHLSTASRLLICATTASQITIRTRQDGVSGQPRAYSGANDISFDWQPVDTGDSAVVITVTGAPANNFHVQFDSNVGTGTTVTQMLAALNGNVAFATTNGLEAVVEGGGAPAEVGFPAPPASVGANKVYLDISIPEKATRFMSGAADAEKHIITNAHLTSFWAADGGTLNKLIEGDVLCLRYDDLVMALDGGRRQSINATPENKATSAGANLFLMRRFPERLPGALPVAAVVDGKLIFVNGRGYSSGEVGALVPSGNTYQGSATDFADTTALAAGTFESALDALVTLLGKKTTTVGAAKIGIDAIAGTTFSVSAGSVRSAISDVLTGANDHINDATAAHAGTAISYAPTTPVDLTGITTVTSALDTLDDNKASLGVANTFTKANVFTPDTAATAGMTSTGNTSGSGAVHTAGNAGYGLELYPDSATTKKATLFMSPQTSLIATPALGSVTYEGTANILRAAVVGPAAANEYSGTIHNATKWNTPGTPLEVHLTQGVAGWYIQDGGLADAVKYWKDLEGNLHVECREVLKYYNAANVNVVDPTITPILGFQLTYFDIPSASPVYTAFAIDGSSLAALARVIAVSGASPGISHMESGSIKALYLGHMIFRLVS